MARKLGPDAFDYYVSLGTDRSYKAVGEKYGASKRAVTSLAKKEDWRVRIRQQEEAARQRADQKYAETLDAMKERHLKSSRVIQGKALQTLRDKSLESAMEAVRALDMAIKQERLIRGEPTDRTAFSIEQIIRREHEQWMREQDQDDTKPDEETDDDQAVV